MGCPPIKTYNHVFKESLFDRVLVCDPAPLTWISRRHGIGIEQRRDIPVPRRSEVGSSVFPLQCKRANSDDSSNEEPSQGECQPLDSPCYTGPQEQEAEGVQSEGKRPANKG